LYNRGIDITKFDAQLSQIETVIFRYVLIPLQLLALRAAYLGKK